MMTSPIGSENEERMSTQDVWKDWFWVAEAKLENRPFDRRRKWKLLLADGWKCKVIISAVTCFSGVCPVCTIASMCLEITISICYTRILVKWVGYIWGCDGLDKSFNFYDLRNITYWTSFETFTQIYQNTLHNITFHKNVM
jgi:hypothetical protein